MLVFENITMFEAIYDSAQTVYPEIKDLIIVVGFTESENGVMLLEGQNEDIGKFKILINSDNDDQKLTATYFMAGLSMVVYKLKYNDFVQPTIDNLNYKEIMDNIVASFMDTPYRGEYVYE